MDNQDLKFWEDIDEEMEGELSMKIARYDGTLCTELRAKLENSLLDSELEDEQVKTAFSEEDALIMV